MPVANLCGVVYKQVWEAIREAPAASTHSPNKYTHGVPATIVRVAADQSRAAAAASAGTGHGRTCTGSCLYVIGSIAYWNVVSRKSTHFHLMLPRVTCSPWAAILRAKGSVSGV